MEGRPFTHTNVLEHTIEVTSEVPIKCRQYRQPKAAQKALEENLKKYLELGIVQKSDSPWSSPLWAIPRKSTKDGERRWRIVTDFRELNKITVGQVYPLIQPYDILDAASSAKFISTIDCVLAFFQVPLAPSSRKYTAFNGPNCKLEFLRMNMGGKNSAQTWCRLMDLVLEGLLGHGVYVYLDDIVIYASSLEEHEKLCTEVFERLKKAKILLDPKKCMFLRREAQVLGHIVGNNQFKPNPEKISAIKNYPVPNTLKKVRAFIGMSSYFRRFIKDFSAIAKPLSDLLKKNQPFIWGIEQQKSFETLKEKLCSNPILATPNFNKPFSVIVDASDFAVGAVLEQTDDNDRVHVIAYASRLLKKSELAMSTYLKELSAVIFGIQQFRPYIFGTYFTVYSDHLPLTFLKKQKHTTLTACNLASKLTGYDFDIVYKPGKKNVVADALSRHFPIGSDQEDPEKSRLELLKEAESANFVDSNSSDSSDFMIRKIRATRKKGENKEVWEDDNSSDEDYRPKRIKADSYNTIKNKRVTRSAQKRNLDKENTMDINNKIAKPNKDQEIEVIKGFPKKVLPEKYNNPLKGKMNGTKAKIILKEPKLILNRLPENILPDSPRKRKVNIDLQDTPKKRIISHENIQLKAKPKNMIKRKVNETIVTSPKKQNIILENSKNSRKQPHNLKNNKSMKNLENRINRSKMINNNELRINVIDDVIENQSEPYFQLLFPEETNLYHKGTYDVIIKGEKHGNNEIINIEMKTHNVEMSKNNINMMNNMNKSVNNEKLNKNKNMVISNENNLLKKNVIINEENNEEIIIDEVDYDAYDSTEE